MSSSDKLTEALKILRDLLLSPDFYALQKPNLGSLPDEEIIAMMNEWFKTVREAFAQAQAKLAEIGPGYDHNIIQRISDDMHVGEDLSVPKALIDEILSNVSIFRFNHADLLLSANISTNEIEYTLRTASGTFIRSLPVINNYVYYFTDHLEYLIQKHFNALGIRDYLPEIA